MPLLSAAYGKYSLESVALFGASEYCLFLVFAASLRLGGPGVFRSVYGVLRNSFHNGRLSAPHASGDALFLGSEGVGVDRRHLKAGMAHPFRQHVERHARTDGMDTVAVAQPLG